MKKLIFLFALCAQLPLSAMEVDSRNSDIDLVTEIYFKCVAPEPLHRYFELSYDPIIAAEDPDIDDCGNVLPATTPPDAVWILHMKYGTYALPICNPKFTKKHSSFKWFRFVQKEPFSFKEVHRLLTNNSLFEYGFSAIQVLTTEQFEKKRKAKIEKICQSYYEK